MPYKKSYKKSYNKSKPVPGWGGSIGRVARYARTFTSTGSVANKALKIASKVADAVNIEYKETEGNLTQNPDYNGIITDLSALISQGVGKSQRTGDSVKLQRLTLRGMCINNQAIGGTGPSSAPEQFRVILYHDKTNTINTGANLLQYSGSSFCDNVT